MYQHGRMQVQQLCEFADSLQYCVLEFFERLKEHTSLLAVWTSRISRQIMFPAFFATRSVVEQEVENFVRLLACRTKAPEDGFTRDDTTIFNDLMRS